MTSEQILTRLRKLANPKNVEGMARFGINPENTFGVSVPTLRSIAKEAGRDHKLAAGLWKSGYHEARIIAPLVDEPARVTEKQMERWVRDFDSWDICDLCCNNLFRKTEFAHGKAQEWCTRDEEFVRRAGFVMMAVLAVHDKAAPDSRFTLYLTAIRRGATDERNFVKKAVNWALRQIGKRNLALNRKAVEAAERIATLDSKAARWIAADALKELRGEKVQEKLRRKAAKQ
ncbi:MAG: DNA alkylation repair protein [Candidatus Eisenbacteria sp.]|nr:DNA alkylation repair protein [Candidatus Eisenbacteria bacterium]